MNLDEYQKAAFQFAEYIDDVYPLLAIGEEAGELQGVFAKAARKYGEPYSAPTDRIINELGGVLWNLAAIATECGISLEEVAEANLELLTQRKAAGTISAVDKRDE